MRKILLLSLILTLSSCQLVQQMPLEQNKNLNTSPTNKAEEAVITPPTYFENGRYSIFSANLDGSDLGEVVNHNKERTHISVSHDGKKLLYVEYTKDLNKDGLVNHKDNKSAEINILDLESLETKSLTENKEFIDTAPNFSPDGRYIVFASDRDKAYRYTSLDLYKLDLASNEVMRFTKSMLATETDPTWTGNTIIYSYFLANKLSNAELITVDEDGTNSKTILNVAIDGGDFQSPFGDYEATISPDGRMIAFSRYFSDDLTHRGEPVGDRDVFIINRSGTDLRNLSGNAEADTQPAFSPDSKLLAFTRMTEKESEIVIHNLETGEEHLLNFEHLSALKSHPAFGPDGKIWFAGERQ